MYPTLIDITYVILLYIIVPNIFDIIFDTIKPKKEKDQKLLESPNNYFFGKEKINDISLDENLVQIIEKFMVENNLYENGVIVSLSGGVDSMVVLAILLRLQYNKFFKICTSTINYNLRPESKLESDFLEKYCINYRINSNVSHLYGTCSNGNKRGLKSNSGISKRSEFEETSKNIRFDSYKNIINEHNCNGVMVGHHGDDIIENIFIKFPLRLLIKLPIILSISAIFLFISFYAVVGAGSC